MESKTKIPFRYIAGGCFAARTVIYLIDSFSYQNPFTFDSLSMILSFAAIAVGLFLSVPMVSAAGSALFLIYHLIRNGIPLFINISDNFSSLFILGTCFLRIPFVIFALLLLITCLNRRSAKVTGIIAAAVRFIPAAYVVYLFVSFGGTLWRIVLVPLLECAGAVFLGFAFSELKDKPRAAAAAAPTASGVSDTYEKLTHLKELLDKGIITQEDFDAKKRDILGS